MTANDSEAKLSGIFLCGDSAVDEFLRKNKNVADDVVRYCNFSLTESQKNFLLLCA